MSYYNGQRIDDDFHPQEKETGIHDKGLSKYLYTLIGFVKPEYNNQAAFDIQHPHGSYQHYLASLPTVPAADPSKFIVGNWYEEGKDFVMEKEETGVERKIYACHIVPPLRLKQYGVNDLSSISETPVFNEGIRRLNQAGFEAANKAMEEIEKAEIEKEANEFLWFVKKERLIFYKKCSESDWWYQSAERRVVIENMLIAYDQMAERLSKRCNLHSLLLHSEQKLRDSTRLLELAGQRIKELEEAQKRLMEDANTLANMQSESMGWLVEANKKVKLLEDKLKNKS